MSNSNIYNLIDMRLEEQEQYSRRTSLRFHNVRVPTDQKGNIIQPVIRRGFVPGFVNYKKGALDSQPQLIKFTSCLSWSVVLPGYSKQTELIIISYSRLVFGTSRTVGSAKKFVRITSGVGGGEFTKTLRKVCTCQKFKFSFLLLSEFIPDYM
jgi:hypothetical protein